MKNILTFIFISFIFICSLGQTVTDLYKNKNYSELIKFEQKGDKLEAQEFHMIGFAYFQLGNDQKAIENYDKAIAKGYDNGSTYFYKGLSFCYLKQYDDAMKNIEIALQKEPENQEFMNQKGLIYKYKGQEDKALNVFEQATKLPNTFGEPYFWIAYIYHGKEDFQKALDLYYIALDKVPKTNSHYQTTLESIGQLEYTFTKNYLKSAEAYSEAIQLDKENYELYYKLIKAYNAGKEYKKGENIFKLVKIAFENGKLPKEDMEIKTIRIAEFEWNGQRATIIKSLVDPKNTLDISYKVFLINKKGDALERRFVIEKTVQFENNGPNHLLCEQDKKTGDHITYPYGWIEDEIPLDDLEKVVKLVLDGKMKYAAKSNFDSSK